MSISEDLLAPMAASMAALNRMLAAMSPEERIAFERRIAQERDESMGRAHDMRGVYRCCPAHGEPIESIDHSRYRFGDKEFTFDNLMCGKNEYCSVDISNDPALLAILSTMTPLSQDRPFSSKPEPDRARATVRADDICPYCAKSGGSSVTLGYIDTPVMPRTFTLRTMDCGHTYAMVYRIS